MKTKSSKKSSIVPEKSNVIKCGLCGKRNNLITTECCNHPLCDDADQYVLFSFARNSCMRNHDRYTLCGHHYHNSHKNAWQKCKECSDSFETEMYVWYGTNEYNFEKLENPPIFEPTRCHECSKIIKLGTDGYSSSAKGYSCMKCTNKRLRELEKTLSKNP